VLALVLTSARHPLAGDALRTEGRAKPLALATVQKGFLPASTMSMRSLRTGLGASMIVNGSGYLFGARPHNLYLTCASLACTLLGFWCHSCFEPERDLAHMPAPAYRQMSSGYEGERGAARARAGPGRRSRQTRRYRPT
jgi:hypothetical protein